MYQREQIGLMLMLLWQLHCTLCRIYWMHIYEHILNVRTHFLSFVTSHMTTPSRIV